MIDDLDIMERNDQYVDPLDFIESLDYLDVPDIDLEYELNDDEGCEGGACRI